MFGGESHGEVFRSSDSTIRAVYRIKLFFRKSKASPNSSGKKKTVSFRSLSLSASRKAGIHCRGTFDKVSLERWDCPGGFYGANFDHHHRRTDKPTGRNGPIVTGRFFPASPPDNKNRFYFVQLPAQRSLYYSGRRREKIRPFWAIGGKKSNKEKKLGFGYSMTWSCTGLSGMARAFRNEKEWGLGIGFRWRQRQLIRIWKWGIPCFPS